VTIVINVRALFLEQLNVRQLRKESPGVSTQRHRHLFCLFQESRTSNISILRFLKVGNTKTTLLSFSVYQFLLEGGKMGQPLRDKTLSLCQPSCFFLL
jgi:hypothetical protein